MPQKLNKKHPHPLLEADKIELVLSGEDYFKRALDIINHSKVKLHLQTYIFIDDSTGKAVIEAMENAVKRGVKVKLLVDAFGSFALSNHAIHQMQKSGIEFRTFSPLFVKRRIRFGRRLHHKILVADEREALIGGINVEDKYHIKKGPHTPWLDYAAYISGPIGEYINYLCESTWNGKLYSSRMKYPLQKTAIQKRIPVWIHHNDWALKKAGISRTHRSALKRAHESVTIIGSYFLPGRRVRKLLKKAASKKVKIKLILQGASDVKLMEKASRWWYAWLFRNNIEIYEWTETVLHGKVMLIDKSWASVGSYNINHLSDYASIETNVYVHDPAFCNSVEEEMERVIKLSQQITPTDYHRKMKPFAQFSCWLSFHFVRLLFGLQFALLAKE